MSVWHMQPDLAASRRQHKQLYQVQGRYLRYVGLVALACLLYYVWFFLQFGVSGEQLTTGLQQIGRYLARMFVWHDFWNWPFGYYFTQIGVTLAIVFAGTLTATVLALLLSFFAARNIMRGVVLGTLALLMRRLFDVLRGIDGIGHHNNLQHPEQRSADIQQHPGQRNQRDVVNAAQRHQQQHAAAQHGHDRSTRPQNAPRQPFYQSWEQDQRQQIRRPGVGHVIREHLRAANHVGKVVNRKASDNVRRRVIGQRHA